MRAAASFRGSPGRHGGTPTCDAADIESYHYQVTVWNEQATCEAKAGMHGLTTLLLRARLRWMATSAVTPRPSGDVWFSFEGDRRLGDNASVPHIVDPSSIETIK